MHAEISIRPAELGDVEERVDLYLEVAGEGRWIGGELPLERNQLIEGRRRSHASANHAAWVAVAHGRIIGELGLIVSGGRAELGMEVASAWRGQGAGGALLGVAVAWARERRLDKISLEVWPHNARAIALYEKMGFRCEGYHPRHHRRKSGEVWDSISMGLVL